MDEREQTTQQGAGEPEHTTAADPTPGSEQEEAQSDQDDQAGTVDTDIRSQQAGEGQPQGSGDTSPAQPDEGTRPVDRSAQEDREQPPPASDLDSQQAQTRDRTEGSGDGDGDGGQSGS